MGTSPGQQEQPSVRRARWWLWLLAREEQAPEPSGCERHPGLDGGLGDTPSSTTPPPEKKTTLAKKSPPPRETPRKFSPSLAQSFGLSSARSPPALHPAQTLAKFDAHRSHGSRAASRVGWWAVQDRCPRRWPRAASDATRQHGPAAEQGHHARGQPGRGELEELGHGDAARRPGDAH